MVEGIKTLIYFKKVFMSNLDDHGVATGLNFCQKLLFKIRFSDCDILDGHYHVQVGNLKKARMGARQKLFLKSSLLSLSFLSCL